MRDFPQELVELVIDHVATTRDVGKCGLVCKQWLGRSRMHLFSHLNLANMGPANIESFLNIIQASLIPILSLVRTLHI
ncbi:hypothetical protein DFH06DRAFT_980330, partial [Mycena polygramma]